jgi:hypothetical protein
MSYDTVSCLITKPTCVEPYGALPDTIMNSPAVTRILVEYDDGSCDRIELLQRGEFPLYGLTRKRPDSETPRGAYTTAAIAALLFGTAFTTKWTEYSTRDTKLMRLIRCWLGDSESSKQDAAGRTDKK